MTASIFSGVIPALMTPCKDDRTLISMRLFARARN